MSTPELSSILRRMHSFESPCKLGISNRLIAASAFPISCGHVESLARVIAESVAISIETTVCVDRRAMKRARMRIQTWTRLLRRKGSTAVGKKVERRRM